MDDFETFTREKIARLRSEIDALEKSLKEFQATRARANSRRPDTEARSGGAFGAVLEQLEREGERGMTIEEMMAFGDLMAIPINRNTLRSQLFQAKNDGRVEQMAVGRYRVPQPKKPEATSQNEGYGRSGIERPAPGVTDRGPREQFPADLDDEIPF